MERDLEEMKRRLAAAEKTLAAQRLAMEGSTQERFDTLSRRQAEQQAGLEGVRMELQAINGRISDSSVQRKELQNNFSLAQDDLALKVAALETRLVAAEKRLAAPPPAPVVAADPDPAELYERGLDLVQKGKDNAAGREALEAFLKAKPKSDLAANALYWIGEAWYGDKKYENAILQFDDVIKRHGEHPKAAAAMYKQGLALNALGDRKSARAIMRKLGETYPKSPEAKKAKDKLAEWKK
jgi:tol-pal system protein YbgF